MSYQTRRPKLSNGLQAVLVFGAGFAIAWRCSAGRSSSSIVAPRDTPARVAESREALAQTDRLARLDDMLDRTFPAMEAVPNAAAIQKSRLPEWMRFRYEHQKLALSTEMQLRWALDSSSAAREAVRGCVAKEHTTTVPIDISAEIELQGRDAMVRGWGCDANAEAVTVGRVCNCVLEHLPNDLHVTVPNEVRDEDLVPYEGLLSLRLWP
jgi:hypothetical protein